MSVRVVGVLFDAERVRVLLGWLVGGVGAHRVGRGSSGDWGTGGLAETRGIGFREGFPRGCSERMTPGGIAVSGAFLSG